MQVGDERGRPNRLEATLARRRVVAKRKFFCSRHGGYCSTLTQFDAVPAEPGYDQGWSTIFAVSCDADSSNAVWISLIGSVWLIRWPIRGDS
jgi:hypothetical protein